ncbi:hypothetical protein CEUSTIGMA_g5366.t1 [Chlamydomonas eustigma]|uniref:Calcineurin-like phosphoesterase domain-containing protein n=1 Tax=Chlamydomonas eustigma TaxID=1157962 RepID=A0A250X4B4_9CHLO|nr:hypothetical protein CEUSTIGMA_g5366.t1 [Chlamydomonas eustigma]|eukprot:GAX77924.1 hypothetical protein CEUSTIGMA_g5366.t1 [Chlamydomonas eustigma]
MVKVVPSVCGMSSKFMKNRTLQRKYWHCCGVPLNAVLLIFFILLFTQGKAASSWLLNNLNSISESQQKDITQAVKKIIGLYTIHCGFTNDTKISDAFSDSLILHWRSFNKTARTFYGDSQGIPALHATVEALWCSTNSKATAAANCACLSGGADGQQAGNKQHHKNVKADTSAGAAVVESDLAAAALGRRRLLISSSVLQDYAYLYVYAAYAVFMGYPEVANQVIQYSGADPLWLESVIVNLLDKGKYEYRPVPDIQTGYVYPLTTKTGSTTAPITVAIMGDWGTGMPQALDMLQKIQTIFNPDVVLHLGDVYYSGTSDQQINYQCIPASNLSGGTQYYTIPGNHDYYSGGGPFLDCVDYLRSNTTVTQQQASFHALNGTDWVIVSLDTGYNDRDVFSIESDMTYLEDNQAEWANYQISAAKAAGKRVIVNSHHQLFTRSSTVGQSSNGSYPTVNTRLHANMSASLPHIEAWFWGHEHSLATFEPYAGLQRGRLLGSSAIPMLLNSEPYAPNSELISVSSIGADGLPEQIAGSAEMSEASFGYYYQHSFALLTLTGSKSTITYYELDWDCRVGLFTGGCTWYDPVKIWSETM